MCSGSEAGPYLRLIDFVYHSTLGLRVIKKKKKDVAHIRQSRPDSGLGFQVKVLKPFQVVPSVAPAKICKSCLAGAGDTALD